MLKKILVFTFFLILLFAFNNCQKLTTSPIGVVQKSIQSNQVDEYFIQWSDENQIIKKLTIDEVLTNELNWIEQNLMIEVVDNVDPSHLNKYKTFAMSKDHLKINPYFSNLLAYSLAKFHWEKQKNKVIEQINWYVNHISNADNQVDIQVVCDYDLHKTEIKGVYLQKKFSENRAEFGIGNCADSTDSYHATFLMLIAQVLQNEPQILFDYINSKNNQFKIQLHLILNSLLDLEHDSLTVAKKSYPIKYAMDNVEVLHGIKIFQDQIDLLNFENQSQLISTDDLIKIKRLYSNMENQFDFKMKNMNANNYRICADPGEFCAGGLDRIYPDIQANIWPTIFAVNGQYQWEEFKNTKSYHCWIKDQVLFNDECVFNLQEPPNVVNAELFFIGNQSKFDQDIQNYLNIVYKNRIINNQRQWPWGANEESGWIRLLSNLKMKQF